MAADLAELRMNVAALKRVDPYIKDILGTATQVALYSFNTVNNEWDKTDVEGALFVCSRNGEPYNSILIMNRLNTNNLVEPIIKDLEWQMQAPFLLYRNTRNNIFGIWFYNREECVKTTYLLENIMDSLRKESKTTKPKKTTSEKTDIFSMLSKAQEDFNKTPVKTENTNVQPQASTPRVPDVTSQSVMDFFAKASTTKSTHATPARIPTDENEPLQPLLHRLMSNPAHSVEHIEKQQRAVTPQDQQQGLSILRGSKTPLAKPPANSQNLNSGFLNLSASSTAVRDPSILNIQSISPSTANESVSTVPLSTPKTNQSSAFNNCVSLIRIPSPINPSPTRGTLHMKHSVVEEPETKIKETKTPPLTSLLENSHKPQLMPPMMFAAADPPTEEKDYKEPMTKKQMAQAMIYLLKNDPDFLDKLHEGYIKSFQQSYS